MEEIHYLLGNTCNLSCDFCFWSMRIPTVPWKTKKLIIDEIVRSGIRNVTVSGGEPTCEKDFVKALKYMSDNGLSVVLHTNGLKIDNPMLKRISPLVKRISLSLDGSNEKMCMKMRKKDKFFSHTIMLIDKLNKISTPVNVKTLITKVNADDVINIGELLQTKKLLYWSLLEFNPIDRGKKNESKFSLDDHKFDDIVRKVKKDIKGIDIRVRYFKREQESSYIFISPDACVYKYVPGKGDVRVGDLRNTELKNIIQTGR